MYDFIAQATGIVGMAFGIMSVQGKKPRSIIFAQFCSGVLFSISFFMLGSYSAGILNVVSVLRAILFLQKDKFNAKSNWWLLIFTVLYLASYVISFTVFQVEVTLPKLLLEFMPVIGMLAGHLGFQKDSAKVIRRYLMAASVAWLVYNVAAVAIGAILCEAFSIVSNFIAMIRLDGIFKKKERV